MMMIMIMMMIIQFIIGNFLLKRNASITFQANAPEKLYFLIPNVLSIPLIGSWHQSCYKCSTASKAANRHTGSMMPKSVEQLNVIKQMAARMEWVYIGIMYSGMYLAAKSSS